MFSPHLPCVSKLARQDDSLSQDEFQCGEPGHVVPPDHQVTRDSIAGCNDGHAGDRPKHLRQGEVTSSRIFRVSDSVPV